MKMNNERNKERFDSANAKLGTNDKVQEELAKPEWKERYVSTIEEIYAASSSKELESATKKLQEIFDSVFELITAPGVEEFINWANDLTGDKNAPNAKKLRKFLVENFTIYDKNIEEVNTHKGCIEVDDASIFAGLLKGFRKKIKDVVNKFLSKPDEFENNISLLFATLTKEFKGVQQILELTFHDKLLLLDEQDRSKTSLQFYDSLFDTILKQNQEFKPIGNDNDVYGDDHYKIISARINNTKQSFKLLVRSGVADEPDERLKTIFGKLEDEMTDTKGDICALINSFLEGKWLTIRENFYTIKKFEESILLQFDPNGWKSFEKAATINAVVEDYNNLKQEKCLNEVERASKERVESLLKSKANKISSLKKKIDSCCSEILEVFNKIVETYSNKAKKDMLTKIIHTNQSLRQGFDDIYGETGGLIAIGNGIGILNDEDNDFMESLSDGTITTMIEEGSKIKEKFLETIKASGLEDAINWLEGIGTELNFSTLDKHIVPLLEKGLITITIKKEF